jgi:Protein of unknown function (DUF3810)
MEVDGGTRTDELIEPAPGEPLRRGRADGRRAVSRALRSGLRASRRELGWPLALLLSVVLLQQAAALAPSAVERLYARGIYPPVARTLSSLSGRLPFSAAEAIVLLLLLLLLLTAARQLVLLRRGRVSWRTRPLAFLKFALRAAALSALAFMLCFGLNYQRTPLSETLAYERRAASAEELERMTRAVVSAVNLNREQAHAGGRPAPPTAEIVRLVEESFRRLPELSATGVGGYGPPKAVRFSAALTRLGVGGLYFPFTAEPNFNAELPDFEQPFSVAHEMAHQRGFARESEANFVAFLVCTRSDDPFVRYSGYRHGLALAAELSKLDPARARALLAELGPGYREDSLRAARFWARARGPAGALSRRLNNLYLKANRVKSGTKNYAESTALLVGYYLKGGG